MITPRFAAMTDRTFVDDVLVPVVIILVATFGMMYVVAQMNEARDRAAAYEAHTDSLLHRCDSLRSELQEANRENRKLRDALNGQIEIMGQAITTETKRPREMKAVAHVIVNRMGSGDFPGIPSGVVLEPGAFSGMPTSRPPADTALVIAREALLEQSRDPTGGATHFYSPVSMEPKWSAPRWAYKLDEVDVRNIPQGRFRFYRQ